jgi:P pilus assembly protein, chaperone PapD
MRWTSVLFAAVLLSGAFQASAGVVVGATRVVFKADKREAELSVDNPTQSVPYLIQSWVDNYAEGDSTKVPFTITPPLFRLDAGQENILRIIPVAANLPQDRESVFWLNVKSIPSSSKSDQNQLQITVKTRIKLFWRPTTLTADAAMKAYKALTFRRQGEGIEVSNPTPYYVSFYSITSGGKTVTDAGMVAPHGTLKVNAPAGGQVKWKAIDDFGGITEEARMSL